jgi:hypothetical protein
MGVERRNISTLVLWRLGEQLTVIRCGLVGNTQVSGIWTQDIHLLVSCQSQTWNFDWHSKFAYRQSMCVDPCEFMPDTLEAYFCLPNGCYCWCFCCSHGRHCYLWLNQLSHDGIHGMATERDVVGRWKEDAWLCNPQWNLFVVLFDAAVIASQNVTCTCIQ